MAETYTSGIWIVKPDEHDELVAAWRDFVSWASPWAGSGRSASSATSMSPRGI